MAENVADELARSDGREVRLEEERELQLPFLLPEDGYSCDVVRGVPQGLAEFLAPLQHAGLCRMSTQPTSGGLWTIYMTHEPNPGVCFIFLLCIFHKAVKFKIRWTPLLVCLSVLCRMMKSMGSLKDTLCIAYLLLLVLWLLVILGDFKE